MEHPPEKSKGDAAYAVAKAFVGSVPVVGHALAVLTEQLLAPPLERRRERWAVEVASAITELQSRDPSVTIDSLQKNESFISAVIQASQAAIRTHRVEKLEALRQAVLSAARPNAPAVDKQEMFLRIIDELSPIHIRVLALLRIRTNENTGYVAKAFERMPELSEGDGYIATVVAQTFIEAIVKDLQFRGLLYLDSEFTAAGNSRGSPSGAGATHFAEEFLAFIGILAHKY